MLDNHLKGFSKNELLNLFVVNYDDAETAHEAYKKQKNILHQIKEIK